MDKQMSALRPMGRKTIGVELEMDRDQLHILMSIIESQFVGIEQGARRSIETLDAEIEAAIKDWNPNEDIGFCFHILKLAPIYAQLLAIWGQDRIQIAPVSTTSDLFEFVAAVKAARREDSS
jgi:hypothetical protein